MIGGAEGGMGTALILGAWMIGGMGRHPSLGAPDHGCHRGPGHGGYRGHSRGADGRSGSWGGRTHRSQEAKATPRAHQRR